MLSVEGLGLRATLTIPCNSQRPATRSRKISAKAIKTIEIVMVSLTDAVTDHCRREARRPSAIQVAAAISAAPKIVRLLIC